MASFRSVVPVVLGVVIAACGSSSSSGGGTPDAGGGADSGPGGDSGPGTPPPGSTDAGSDAMSDSGCTGTLTALHFTTNDTVTIADAASLSMGAAGTIEAWVLLDAPGAGGIVHGLIYDKWVSAVEDKSLGVEANGLYAGGIFESVSSTRSVEAIDPSSAGKWTHVAMSYDATSMRLFVDGKKVTTLAGPTTPANSSGEAHIGFEPREPSVSASFLGFISEVRVSTIARYDADFVSPIHLGTDANTAALWKLDEGSGTTANDTSGNTNTGTITGAAWMTAPCR